MKGQPLTFIAGVLTGVALLAAGASCSRGGGGGDDTVATINEEKITTEELHKYLELKPTVNVISQQGAVTARVVNSLGYQALEDLIRSRLIFQMAKDEGVYPTEVDVKNEIEFRKKRDPNYLTNFTTRGYTGDMIKRQLQLELAQERLITKGITISPEEVQQYIKENPSQFKEPETADLTWVLVSTEDQKKQVDQDFASGQSVAAIAQRYSQAPNARSQRGVFPVRNLNQMTPQLRELIQKTPELKTTTWQKVGSNWAKWYVEKKTPAKDVVIDDTVKEIVRRQIAIQRGRAANDLNKRLVEKLKASKVEIEAKPYKDPWQRMLDNLGTGSNASGTSMDTSTAGTGGATAGTASPEGTATTGGD